VTEHWTKPIDATWLFSIGADAGGLQTPQGRDAAAARAVPPIQIQECPPRARLSVRYRTERELLERWVWFCRRLESAAADEARNWRTARR
jgi:hypothetical protein